MDGFGSDHFVGIPSPLGIGDGNFHDGRQPGAHPYIMQHGPSFNPYKGLLSIDGPFPPAHLDIDQSNMVDTSIYLTT